MLFCACSTQFIIIIIVVIAIRQSRGALIFKQGCQFVRALSSIVQATLLCIERWGIIRLS